MDRFLFTLLLCVISLQLKSQPPTEKITFTGTIKEEITLTVLGEKLKVSSLPFELVLKQEQIPMTITVESPNYEYRSIFIPKYTKKDFKIAKQTGDLIKRTYLVYGEKKEQQQQQIVYYVPPVANTPSQETIQTQKANLQTDNENKILLEIDQPPLNVTQTDAKTFAIIVANEDYVRECKVPYSLNDGEVFANYCEKTLGLPAQNIHLVKNATLNDMKFHLNWLKQVMEAYNGEAKAIIYYAGHGIPDESERAAFLLPVDGYATDITTGYSLQTLYETLGKIPSKLVTIFLDACFSGAKREGDMLVAARGITVKVKEGSPLGNMVVFSAAQGDETAYPYKEQQHGMFTYYLLKKLQETQGEATLGELKEYVVDQVRKRSIVVNGKMQTPTMIASPMIGEGWLEHKLK
ncbi:MAG: caspase family protein [Bacteroides sp.]|nr:caspase family protein [Bacteroides sp.]